MRSSACVRCAKSKVRCDRREPCSTCRKRHKDCHYADDSTSKRVQLLEDLVRKLGGNPNQALQSNELTIQPRPRRLSVSAKDNEAITVQDGNESQDYDETVWQSPGAKQSLDTSQYNQSALLSSAIPGRSPVFKYILQGSDHSFEDYHPLGDHARYLWDCYFERVHPALMPFFKQEVDDLKSKCAARLINFSNQEHAFVFAIYLMTIISLSEQGCLILGRTRADLLQHYQMACERALFANDFLTTHDMMSIQTLLIYLHALFTAYQFYGSWDAIGLLLRKAERLGLHRDGTLLKLPPYETERRRRLWWCIQHIDFASNTVTGTISIHLLGEWDTQLPLNIEDEDIDAKMTSPPKERTGITSMSHCLWRYWMLAEQRAITLDGKRLGFSWVVNKAMSREARNAVIDRIEQGLTERWLRFCDPIKALDMAVLILAKSLINFWRRALLASVSVEPTMEEHRALLDFSVKALEYHASMFSIPYLEPLQWHQRFLFPWGPYSHVAVELSRVVNLADAARLWDKIALVYQTMPQIDCVHDNQKTVYPVKLTIKAWYHVQGLREKSGLPKEPSPSRVQELELQLYKVNGTEEDSGQGRIEDVHGDLGTAEQLPATFWSDLQDIPMQAEDWLFWGIPDSEMLT